MKYRFVKHNAFKMPDFVVDKKHDIVKWGQNNKFPQFLLDLSTKTGLHTAILNTKKLYICGNGLTYEGDTNKKTDDFLANPNPYESMNDLLEKCAVDLEIFGGFALETIWTKDKKYVAEVYHIPFQNIRTALKNNKNQIDTYHYNNDWNEFTRYNDTITYPRFGDTEKSVPQLLYTRQYTPTNPYYPVPDILEL